VRARYSRCFISASATSVGSVLSYGCVSNRAKHPTVASELAKVPPNFTTEELDIKSKIIKQTTLLKARTRRASWDRTSKKAQLRRLR
jgi:hypothetical protein